MLHVSDTCFQDRAATARQGGVAWAGRPACGAIGSGLGPACPQLGFYLLRAKARVGYRARVRARPGVRVRARPRVRVRAGVRAVQGAMHTRRQVGYPGSRLFYEPAVAPVEGARH